jgi:outer membrane lipoprotein-sorting protein
MRIAATIALAAAVLLAPSRGPAATLEQVLAAVDKAAAGFRTMSADLTKVDHTAVINDDSEESGRVRMKRLGPRDIRYLIEYVKPDPRIAVFEKNTAQVYYPKMKEVQVWDLGKYRSLVDQFLLLGFGTPVANLKRSYSLRVIGEEQIGGEAATRLELIPLSPSVLDHLKKAELWISAGGYPVQQKFHEASGDYKLVTYKDVKLNAAIPDDAFRLKLPADVRRMRPQK